MGALGESGISRGVNDSARIPGASGIGANREVKRREQTRRGRAYNSSTFGQNFLGASGSGSGAGDLAQQQAIQDIISGRRGGLKRRFTWFSWTAFNREWDREKVFAADYG